MALELWKRGQMSLVSRGFHHVYSEGGRTRERIGTADSAPVNAVTSKDLVQTLGPRGKRPSMRA